MYLGMNLIKTKNITCSDWETKFLNSKQIIYAATDAWVGRESKRLNNFHIHYFKNYIISYSCNGQKSSGPKRPAIIKFSIKKNKL